MSKEKSTPTKTTTPSRATKRGRGRPRKADKTTVKVVTQDESQNKQVPATEAIPAGGVMLGKARSAKRRPASAADMYGHVAVSGPRAFVERGVTDTKKATGRVVLDARGRKAKKPPVNVAQLENSLKEAVTAKAETEKRADQLESELKAARTENRLLQRTINRLQTTIDELKAKNVKRSIWPWRRG